mgnify:CR=1 FL=1
MSPAELPKGSVPGAFFRKVGKPEFAKATPAARYLSWLLLGVGDTSEQALAACGPLTAGRFACPAGYSGLSGAIAPGADKPRLRPFSRLTRGGPPALPLCYPHLCLAQPYWTHASTSGGGSFN